MSKLHAVSRVVYLSVVLLFAASSALAQTSVLFPRALHLTRHVDDPFSQKTIVIEQYCQGNRVVTVRGATTQIADYEKGELTEIDRDAGTYSITSFADVAKALRTPADGATLSLRAADGKPSWSTRAIASKSAVDSRSSERYEVDAARGAWKLEVGVDRAVGLSREAAEVLVGSAFPSSRRDQTDAVLSVVAPPQARGLATESADRAAPAYGLPVEQVTTVEIEGERVQARDRVVRIGDETAPASALAIPADARRTDSRLVVRTRMLEELEGLPQPLPAKP